MATSLDRERCVRLGAFLRERRHRIVPSAQSIGPHRRPPARHGRRVTQEELAEVIDVSRTWYVLLESGAEIRISTRLLHRLALALALTPLERMTLFYLAVPELEGVPLT